MICHIMVYDIIIMPHNVAALRQNKSIIAMAIDDKRGRPALVYRLSSITIMDSDIIDTLYACSLLSGATTDKARQLCKLVIE